MEQRVEHNGESYESGNGNWEMGTQGEMRQVEVRQDEN